MSARATEQCGERVRLGEADYADCEEWSRTSAESDGSESTRDIEGDGRVHDADSHGSQSENSDQQQPTADAAKRRIKYWLEEEKSPAETAPMLEQCDNGSPNGPGQVMRKLSLADPLASEEIVRAEMEQQKRKLSTVNFSNSTRYVVLCIALACLTLIISNSLALNFTIICMGDDTSDEAVEEGVIEMQENGSSNPASSVSSQPRPLFSVAQTSSLFSAVAVGTLIGTVPVTYLTSRFGIRFGQSSQLHRAPCISHFRLMFTGYGLVSAFSILLTPLAASLGFLALFAARIATGLAVATSFVAMGAISAEWSSLKGSGMYLALLSCHLQFGTVFTMPVAGMLCESSWGWPSLYYLQGGLTLLSFILFYEFYRDSPRFQKHVSDRELAKIEAGKTSTGLSRKESRQIHVPYRAMFNDWVIRGIIISYFGGSLGFHINNQFGPVYLNKALKMDVRKTGWAAAFPYFLSFIVKWIAGAFSDYLTCVSDKGRVIFFASTSQFMMAACFAALNFIPHDWPLLIQTCFTLSTVFSGLNAVGVVKAAQMAARHFSHVVMAWNTLLGAMVVLLLPVAVGFAAPENTQQQWGRLFFASAIIVTLVTLVFNFTVEVEPREWTILPAARSMTKVSAANTATTIATANGGGINPAMGTKRNEPAGIEDLVPEKLQKDSAGKHNALFTLT